MKAHIHKNGWSAFQHRPDDPTSYDWDKAALAAIGDVAGTYYNLDMSSVVPEDTLGVLMRVVLTDNALTYMRFKPYGNANDYVATSVYIQVANVINEVALVIPVKSQKIQWKGSVKISDFIGASLMVLGWWVT